MDDPHPIDPTQKDDRPLGPGGLVKLLGQSGDGQNQEQKHGYEMLKTLQHTEAHNKLRNLRLFGFLFGQHGFHLLHGPFSDPLAVCSHSPDVEDDVKNQPPDDKGDEDPVHQLDVINQREFLGAGLVVGKPGSREILRYIAVASLAHLDQVCLHRQRTRTGRRLDVVNPMAVRAHRLQCLLGKSLLTVEGNCHPMKILQVGVQDIGRDTVLLHADLIAVAAGAQVRNAEPEGRRAGIFDAVTLVAIGANRHIGISPVQNGLPVHAADVAHIDLPVAAGAGLRNPRSVFSGPLDVVSPVAIHTDRGSHLPFGNQIKMDAIQRFGVIREVATLAAFILSQSVFPATFHFELGMRYLLSARMAIRAIEALAMNGARELLRVHQ